MHAIAGGQALDQKAVLLLCLYHVYKSSKLTSHSNYNQEHKCQKNSNI